MDYVPKYINTAETVEKKKKRATCHQLSFLRLAAAVKTETVARAATTAATKAAMVGMVAMVAASKAAMVTPKAKAAAAMAVAKAAMAVAITMMAAKSHSTAANNKRPPEVGIR